MKELEEVCAREAWLRSPPSPEPSLPPGSQVTHARLACPPMSRAQPRAEGRLQARVTHDPPASTETKQAAPESPHPLPGSLCQPHGKAITASALPESEGKLKPGRSQQPGCHSCCRCPWLGRAEMGSPL